MQRSKSGVLPFKPHFAAALVALLAGCATGEYSSQAARSPLSKTELAAYDVSVLGSDSALSEEFAHALADRGFKVVAHAPYHEELEVIVSTEKTAQGPVAVATMRSDGFFVDEVRAPEDGPHASVQLAEELAASRSMAWYVRNSGTPQQRDVGAE
jgi:hypothetical protein